MFRNALVGLRFSIRYFIDCLNLWKALDIKQKKSSLEDAYMEMYAVYLTLSKGNESNANADFERVQSQMQHLRSLMIDLW